MRTFVPSLFRTATGWGLAVFLLSGLVAAGAVWRLDQSSIDAAKAQAEIDVAEQANAIQVNVDRALSATYALGAMVKQGRGHMVDFDSVAAKLLPYYPGVESLQLAPDGIVQQIYPLAGNERAIGHNLLADPQRNKESLLAKASGQLTLAGPFNLVQGGIGAAGRLPVYLPTKVTGKPEFWGFAIALIRFPDVLGGSGLNRLKAHGYQYRLWKKNPNTGGPQIIASSGALDSSDPTWSDPVELPLATPNGTWYFAVARVHGWRNGESTAVNVCLGVLLSLMLGLISKQMVDARNSRHNLSRLVDERTAELSNEVAERKLAQSVASTEALRLAAILETASDGIHILNSEGILVEANTAFLAMLGHDTSVIGKLHVCDWDALSDWATIRARNDALIESGGIKVFETRHKRADGEIIDVEINAAGSKIDGQGFLYAASRDITLRKKQEAERSRNEQALAESESRFRQIFNSVNDAIFIHDAQTGRILDVNHSMCEMYGLSYEQALTCELSDLCVDTPMYRAADAITKIKLTQTDGVQSFDWLTRAKGGRPLWTSVSLKHARIGSQERVLAVVRDVSQRKEFEAKLQLAANVFEYAREGITITDAQGTIVDVNQAFSRITGYSREEVIGKNPRVLRSGRHGAEFYSALWGALTVNGYWGGEIWNRRKSGEVYAELLTISAVRNKQGDTAQYVALFSDISAIKSHQAQLEQIAHFDPLTHLPNRLLIADRLHLAMAQAQRRGQKLAVLYLDLDGFKSVNDHHGHDVGDQLLMAVSSVMKNALREGDTLGRIGGDEFVAILMDLDSVEHCVPLLARLVEAAAAPVQLGEHRIQISASVGVTFYPQHLELEADQLLRQADQAMYQAKLAGKNRFHVFDPLHDNSIRGHHENIERMRLGLEQGEFVVHYQPKVNMRSGKVIGTEALIRWQHPEKGLLVPAQFLPDIEEHPLAVDVGEWVIDTVLKQLEAWHAAGLDLSVSVNIGARQLQQSDFVQRLQAILRQHPRVNPANLEFEVLETSALADIDQVSQLIEDCAVMGVKFALDDFGTGYSSLTYMKRLRAATIKIDRSFVRDMLEDPEDRAILEGVIGLASAFNREVVAEGVETVAHGVMLLQMGCSVAQGFGIARPMPPGQLPDWIATWQPDAAWCAISRHDLSTATGTPIDASLLEYADLDRR